MSDPNAELLPAVAPEAEPAPVAELSPVVEEAAQPTETVAEEAAPAETPAELAADPVASPAEAEAIPEPEAEAVPEPEALPEPEAVLPAPVAEPEAIQSAAIAEAPAAAAPAPIAIPEPEPTPEPIEEGPSFGEIFAEFEQSHQRRSEDDRRQIRGTVLKSDEEFVYVDIGYKSEGTLPLTAFPAGKLPEPGVTVLVSVKGRSQDGYYELSLFRTAVPKDWTGLEAAFAEKATIVGTVTALVKGGLHVDVGVRAFLPASRSGAREAGELEALVGTEIRCRITKLDVADEDVVVDRRIVLEQEALAQKAESFAAVAEGSIVTGTVRSLTDYGAFVDLGGVDGLLHISDISLTRISKASDVLTVGQEIEVKVLKIDPATQKISLGLKQLQADPWSTAVEKYPLGTTIRGVVTRTTDFGAFVEIEPGLEGLVHLSEMSWSRRILKATEVMKAGDVIDAVILSVTPGDRRISLSLKQALGDPWAEAAKTLHVGAVVEGKVASIQKFGAFVQIAEGVEGLVHISEIVADRRLNHPSDALRVGGNVQALVLGIDTEKRQLKLSIKQLIPTGLDEFLAEQTVGTVVTGRVVTVDGDQLAVELGDGIIVRTKAPAAKAEEAAPAAAPGKVDLSAFSSMLKNKWKTGGDSNTKAKAAVAAGQVRSFRITALDAAAKRIEVEIIP